MSTVWAKAVGGDCKMLENSSESIVDFAAGFCCPIWQPFSPHLRNARECWSPWLQQQSFLEDWGWLVSRCLLVTTKAYPSKDEGSRIDDSLSKWCVKQEMTTGIFQSYREAHVICAEGFMLQILTSFQCRSHISVVVVRVRVTIGKWWIGWFKHPFVQCGAVTALNAMYGDLQSDSRLTKWVSNGGDPCGDGWSYIGCTGSSVTSL